MTRRARLVAPALLAIAALGCFLAFAMLSGPRPPRADRPAPGGALTLEFLDVGQGDAILIRSPEGKTALIDAGPSRHVADLLHDRGIRGLDLAVVSHHHADHYGGMAEVVRQFRPRAFLDADSSHASGQYLALLEAVEKAGCASIRPTSAPRNVDLGSVRLTILPQPPDDREEENNNSVGIRLQFGDFSALLTGDSETRERKWWMKHAPDLCAEVNILKLAHHGSRNGVDVAWLNLTHPQLAVASLAAGNDFGHPHPETLTLLAGLGIPLRRTDLDGTITIRSDGRTWTLARTDHPARAPPPSDSSYRGPAPARADGHRARGGLVHLNTSSLEDLQTLPGIGPELARRIMAGRPYRSVDDLLRVDGLGRKRVEHIRPFLEVD